MRVQPWCVVDGVDRLRWPGIVGPLADRRTGQPCQAAASRPSEEERARKLAEGLAATAKVIEDTQAGEKLGQMAEAAKESWTSPYVQRLTACTPLLARCTRPRRRARAADLCPGRPAGAPLVVDSVYEDTTVKLQEYKAAFTVARQKRSRPRPARQGGARPDAGTKLTSFFASIMDLFDFPIPIVLQYGPVAAQASTFTAVADGLPRVKPRAGAWRAGCAWATSSVGPIPPAKKQAVGTDGRAQRAARGAQGQSSAAKKAAPGGETGAGDARGGSATPEPPCPRP